MSRLRHAVQIVCLGFWAGCCGFHARAQVFDWAKSMGGGNTDQAWGIAVDGGGNVYVAGYIGQGTADFNAGGSGGMVTSAGGDDVFLAKYDANGGFLWAKAMGGSSTDRAWGVAADANGNVYVTGYIGEGTADFNPGGSGGSITSTGNNNIFLAKYDATGNYLWAKSMGSSADDQGYDVTVDGSGYLWGKSMGGGSADNGLSVAVDGSGNVYVTGYFQSAPADFNPGGTGGTIATAGNLDGFLAKYDAGGSFLWAKSMGDVSADGGYGVSVDGAGNVVAAGYFQSPTVDFDPGGTGGTIATAGGQDIFVVKYLDYAGCTNGSSLTKTACKSYSYGGVNYTASGIYADTLTNASGCDSIVTLYLTIIDTVRTTITDTACDSYTFQGTTYTTGGSYDHAFTSSMSCDSVVTLHLTINRSYHRTDTLSACYSYVFHGRNLTGSGIYSDTFATAAGCDSILTLNLTIHTGADTSLWVQACDSFVLNDTVYAISGTYTQVSLDSFGCISTTTLHLLLGNSPEAAVILLGTTLTAGSADAWQWIDCNDGNAAIAGATAQTFTPARSGSYAVVVTEGSCSDTSDCYTVTTDGIDEPGGNNKIGLYPNPANGKVTIEAEQALSDATIRLISIDGQLLLAHTKQHGKHFEFDLTPYAGGIYFMEISEGGNTVRMKLVKQ